MPSKMRLKERPDGKVGTTIEIPALHAGNMFNVNSRVGNDERVSDSWLDLAVGFLKEIWRRLHT